MAYYAIFYMFISIANPISDLLKIVATTKGAIIITTIFLVLAFTIYFIIKFAGEDKAFFKNKYIIKVKNFLTSLHWRNNNFTKAIGIAGALSYLTFSILYLLVLIPIIYIGFPYAAFAQGEKSEQEKRDNYIANGCTQEKKKIFNACHSLKSKNGEFIVEGLLITESDNMIAFFTKDGSYVSERPKDAILIKALHK